MYLGEARKDSFRGGYKTQPTAMAPLPVLGEEPGSPAPPGQHSCSGPSTTACLQNEEEFRIPYEGGVTWGCQGLALCLWLLENGSHRVTQKPISEAGGIPES